MRLLSPSHSKSLLINCISKRCRGWKYYYSHTTTNDLVLSLQCLILSDQIPDPNCVIQSIDMKRAKLQTLTGSGRVARCTIVSCWRYLRYSHVRYVACVRHDRSRILEILVLSLFSLILSTSWTWNTDLQIANLLGHCLASTCTTAIDKRTMTVLPLVYAILSLFELILVDSPRVVAGLQGIKSSFLNDITPMSSIQNLLDPVWVHFGRYVRE